MNHAPNQQIHPIAGKPSAGGLATLAQINMNEIDEIQDWYHAQCNGEWEHSSGFKIETLDNPGWVVSVNLIGTRLEHLPFEKSERHVGQDSMPNDDDWYSCKAENGSFCGVGGPHHLRTILQIFFTWQKNGG